MLPRSTLPLFEPAVIVAGQHAIWGSVIVFKRFLPPLALLLTLGACLHGGGTYEFAAVDLTLTVSSGRTVSASVIDHRPYVVNGKESSSFVGTTQGKAGGTADIRTGSGRPLAEELTDAVVRALDRRGIAASAMPLPKGSPEEAILTAFRTQGTERLLVVRMFEWKTKALTRVILRWHLEAIVRDRAGNVLARRATQGTESVGVTNLRRDSADIAIREVSQKLSQLLNDPVIAGALR